MFANRIPNGPVITAIACAVAFATLLTYPANSLAVQPRIHWLQIDPDTVDSQVWTVDRTATLQPIISLSQNLIII